MGPRRLCRTVSRRQVDGGEGPDRLRLPAFQDREVRRRETANGHALIVEHRDIELHQLDPCAELCTLVLSRPCEGQDGHQGDDSAHHCFAGSRDACCGASRGILPPYSALRASLGSTPAARRAGT